FSVDSHRRSSAFTFESSLHPGHVLRSLEEQRQRDVLCDVTVVTAEGQSFRAHRSVLASCSEYFSQRVSSMCIQNAVITLPLEVRLSAGFEPLLKFDLDGACFDFLLPKFFSSTKNINICSCNAHQTKFIRLTKCIFLLHYIGMCP
uniref:BTB and CNC homology 1, basic leucine zipper transcription factor 1 b n=1 Tax=Neogobius melanostomus TaxID=47308 RepID=A0A8C6SRN3_9GOBI